MRNLIFLALLLMGQATSPTPAPAARYKNVLVQAPHVCGGEFATKPLRVVVIGNSLAWAPPLPDFNWAQSNGMAADTLDNDYAHVLCQMLAQRRQQSVALLVVQAWDIETAINQGVTWDKTYADVINNFSPDVLVVQFSDNVVDPAPAERFSVTYNAVLDAAPARVRVCVGGWYQVRPIINDAIQAACARLGGSFVAIGDLFLGADMRGESFDSGVNHGVGSHPNDLGHFEIARRIAATILERSQ